VGGVICPSASHTCKGIRKTKVKRVVNEVTSLTGVAGGVTLRETFREIPKKKDVMRGGGGGKRRISLRGKAHKIGGPDCCHLFQRGETRLGRSVKLD